MKVEMMLDDLFTSDFARKASKYKKLMPVDDQRPVPEQFRWLPLSIIQPDVSTYWDSIIDDQGDSDERVKPTGWDAGGHGRFFVRYSKFHPQLAELVIRYWSSEGDLVVDPFAGRATRGIVSLRLGRRYQGYEVAPKTFKITRTKIRMLGGEVVCDDGCKIVSPRLHCSIQAVRF